MVTRLGVDRMNKDNAKDYLPLVQALADGKTIQYLDDYKWTDGKDWDFTDLSRCYRIKPEPREFWIAVDDNNEATSIYYEPPAIRLPLIELIKVREVIE